MAKARMLHKKISISTQVNRLSLPARLLYTWLIPHADDEGRLKGEPEYIKATVVPMTKWSFKNVGSYLNEIKQQRLIHYWEINNEWFIEFIKWNEYQKIRKDRLDPSKLPSFLDSKDNQLADNGQPQINHLTPEDNITESNKVEENKSEYKENNIAVKNTSKGREIIKVNPKTFSPLNEKDQAALEAWNKIEPNNPDSFSFYLWAVKQEIPLSKIYEFTSEIKQDSSIENKGAVFNKKIASYLEGKQ